MSGVDLLSATASGDVDMHLDHQVKVIAHHCVGPDRHGVHVHQLRKTVFNPRRRFSVLVIGAGQLSKVQRLNNPNNPRS